MKKRALTLIEVMIALGIASLLLAAVLPYFRHTISLKKKFETEKAFVFSKAHVQERLGTLFSQTINNEQFKTVQEKDAPLKLQFEFNNGYDQDEQFRDLVTGSLFLDGDGRLLLVVEKEEVKRSEVLLENLKKIDFKFAYAQHDQFETQSTWIEKKELPLFFILKITFSNEKKEDFYFRLNSSNRLNYPRQS